MTLPRPNEGILSITPYVGGDSALEGGRRAIKLSSNESALGPSPQAVAAYMRAGTQLHRYPDGGSERLRQALAAHHGLPPGQIVCGNGSDEIISSLIHAYAGPGTEVLYSEHGFLMYRLGALSAGATPVAAPESAYTASVEAILERVSERTRMVFLANPNNPTGTYLSAAELERLHVGLPEHVLLVIDAAYAEYVNRNDYLAGAELVERARNVVMTRTFSKIYGLAALRLGWAYCPAHVADVVHRVRPPFNVNAAAQAAGVAALGDFAHTDAARIHNEIWLPRLSAEITALGLEVIPSVGNFFSVGFPEGGPHSAKEALAFLNRRGILPRGLAAYGLAGHLRFTVGLEAENLAVIDGIRDFLSEGHG